MAQKKVRVKRRKTSRISKRPLHLISKNKCTVNLTSLSLAQKNLNYLLRSSCHQRIYALFISAETLAETGIVAKEVPEEINQCDRPTYTALPDKRFAHGINYSRSTFGDFRPANMDKRAKKEETEKGDKNKYFGRIIFSLPLFMINLFVRRCYCGFFIWVALLTLGSIALPAKAQSKIYHPLPISSGKAIADTLSEQDIPTGEGGFARDYYVDLKKGDQVSIDVTSDHFDAVVTLIAEDGSTVAENDDGPDGTTNSLLFARITEDGRYIVRVRAFGETSGGKFTLKLTRLKPTQN